LTFLNAAQSIRNLLVRQSTPATLLLLAIAASTLAAQSTPAADSNSGSIEAYLPDAPAPQSRDEVTLRGAPVRILHDQAVIWTSPARIRTHDLVWLVPLLGAEAGALATDRHTMTSVVSHDASFNQANTNASNILIGTYIAVPVALFGYGQKEQNARAREAGILGGEAILDGVVVEQGMKLIFWRERPQTDGDRGKFFQGNAGVDTSFPSSHSVLAWSAAAALAGEYPSPWVQAGLYSVATGISLTRVMGQQHFPGDVLAGSAAGWLVGHYVFRTHHRHHIQ
jgi:hypothetical protein